MERNVKITMICLIEREIEANKQSIKFYKDLLLEDQTEWAENQFKESIKFHMQQNIDLLEAYQELDSSMFERYREFIPS